MITDPANIPSGTRRPVLVALAPVRPTTVPGVLLAAARILATNGLWQGDYVPDPFDRKTSAAEMPHDRRPMSIVAAIRCAATGDPHRSSQIADIAIGYVALSLDPGVRSGDWFALEGAVQNWNDEPGRTADAAVALLELLATAPERAA